MEILVIAAFFALEPTFEKELRVQVRVGRKKWWL